MTIRWKRVPASRFEDLLNILPPLDFDGNSFLVGEAAAHRVCQRSGTFAAAFTGLVRLGTECFESIEPLTRREFRELPRCDLAACD